MVALLFTGWTFAFGHPQQGGQQDNGQSGQLNGQQGGRQGGRQGRRGGQGGPPPAVYLTDFPDSPLNVIAGAPTATSIRLGLLCKSSTSVVVRYHPMTEPGTRATVVSSTSSSANTKSGVKPAAKMATSGETQLRAELKADEMLEVELKGLKPGTRYTYTVQPAAPIAGRSMATLEGSFVTARPAGSKFVFEIQADSHLDGNSDTRVYENTLKNMIADTPDFLVDLGDTFMVDKYENYLDSLKQYQAQRYWFSIPGAQMAVFLCLGNHDGETGWQQRGGSQVSEWCRTQRQRYFPAIRPDAFYTGAPAKGLYYAWTWGDAQFLVLDPFVATTSKTRSAEDGWNWTLGKEQFNWFEQTLKHSRSKYKFIFIHHLVGGFGKEARGGVEVVDKFEWGDEKEFPIRRAGWAEPIHSLMRRYGVTAMFHGHDHLYVRQQRDDIAYIEVPQPSHNRGDNTSSAEEYGYKTGKLLGSSGHIRVTVAPKAVKLEYVKSRLTGQNREVVDTFDITK